MKTHKKEKKKDKTRKTTHGEEEESFYLLGEGEETKANKRTIDFTAYLAITCKDKQAVWVEGRKKNNCEAKGRLCSKRRSARRMISAGSVKKKKERKRKKRGPKKY